MTAGAFGKEPDPAQKLSVDQTREHRAKRQSSGGPLCGPGPRASAGFGEGLCKLKQMCGEADMNAFPGFTFEDPKLKSWINPHPEEI